MNNTKKIIPRAIEEAFLKKLAGDKIIILYGPRQVGKTTFVRSLNTFYPHARYIQCEDLSARTAFASQSSETMMNFIGNSKEIILDEAQVVENIGKSLKILHDLHPELKIIATGSSAFDIAQRVVEPMTGRHIDFTLFPFLWKELVSNYEHFHESVSGLESRMLYGSYPEVIFPGEGEDSKEVLRRIMEDYALKDVLIFSGIRKSDKIMLLLRALAYQIGQEVSYQELSRSFGLSIQTIESYIDILEKAFIVFRLCPYVRNKRAGLKRTRKVYFWDTGLRNALINNFDTLDVRPDKGALFENYFISEMHKKSITYGEHKNFYFWRAYDGEEIDLIEEKDGKVLAYECKWKSEKESLQKSKDAPLSIVKVITKENYFKFLE